MTPNAPAWARRLALSRATSACRLACFRKPVTLAQGTFGMPATPGRSNLPRGLHIGGRALCGQGGCPCPGHLRHAGQTRLGKAVTLARGNFGMPASKAQPCPPNLVFFVRKADIWRQNCQNEVKFRLSTIVFGVFTDQIDRRGDRRSNRRRDLGPGV